MVQLKSGLTVLYKRMVIIRDRASSVHYRFWTARMSLLGWRRTGQDQIIGNGLHNARHGVSTVS